MGAVTVSGEEVTEVRNAHGPVYECRACAARSARRGLCIKCARSRARRVSRTINRYRMATPEMRVLITENALEDTYYEQDRLSEFYSRFVAPDAPEVELRISQYHWTSEMTRIRAEHPGYLLVSVSYQPGIDEQADLLCRFRDLGTPIGMSQGHATLT